MIEIYRVKTEQEMKIVRDIRMEVFVGEQGVPVELEMDGLDDEAIHVFALVDGAPAGCARMLLHGEEAKIGRVAVKKSMRRYGLGTGMCKLLFSIAKEAGVKKINIGAQLTAVDFYETLGFEKEGEVFLEAGIAHVKMVRFI
jgi:ElaA protein